MSQKATRKGWTKRWRILAATATVVAGGGVAAIAGAAHADVTCPASGYICEYTDNDFNNDVGYSSIAQSYNNINGHTGDIDGKMSSIRNRTNCAVRLYSGYNYSGQYIEIAAHSEVARIGYTYGPYWNDRAHSHRFVTPSGNC